MSFLPVLIISDVMKIVVDPLMFDAVEEAWAPKDHPVFQLTSPSFEEYYKLIYDSIGRPTVDADSFWMIFSTMQERFDALAAPALAAFATELRTAQQAFEQEVALCFQESSTYQQDIDEHLYMPEEEALPEVAEFTSSESEADEEPEPEYAEFTDTEPSGNED